MLQDKVAVVTGGRRGVGKGIAGELSRHAAKVFVTSVTAPLASAAIIEWKLK